MPEKTEIDAIEQIAEISDLEERAKAARAAGFAHIRRLSIGSGPEATLNRIMSGEPSEPEEKGRA